MEDIKTLFELHVAKQETYSQADYSEKKRFQGKYNGSKKRAGTEESLYPAEELIE